MLCKILLRYNNLISYKLYNNYIDLWSENFAPCFSNRANLYSLFKLGCRVLFRIQIQWLGSIVTQQGYITCLSKIKVTKNAVQSSLSASTTLAEKNRDSNLSLKIKEGMTTKKKESHHSFMFSWFLSNALSFIEVAFSGEFERYQLPDKRHELLNWLMTHALKLIYLISSSSVTVVKRRQQIENNTTVKRWHQNIISKKPLQEKKTENITSGTIMTPTAIVELSLCSRWFLAGSVIVSDNIVGLSADNGALVGVDIMILDMMIVV